MRDRCGNPRKNCFHRYGGRGIRVCDRWDSFENFLADMGTRPSRDHTLDRINNDGDYEPNNCRWATRKEQGRNTSATHFVEFKGERLCIAEWSERLGIRQNTLVRRVQKGIALDAPSQKGKHKRRAAA